MKGLHTNIIIAIGFTLMSTGQFYNILGQSQAKFQTTAALPKTIDYMPEWDFYFSNVDDKLSSLNVDLGLYKIAPLENKSHFMWVSLKMNNARKDGLTSKGENELLGKIEDKLVTKINSKFNSTYAGSLTSNGHKDFYFYSRDTTSYSKTLSEFIKTYPEYQFNFGSKPDENWSGYFNFLYPSPQQFQSIQNRRIIDQLEKNGDKLTKMRDVDHWIYFNTKKDRDFFTKKIGFDGFTIVSSDYDKTSGGLPFKLHIKRIDKVDWNSVDRYVIYLWKLADECNGVYDGWETTVEKY